MSFLELLKKLALGEEAATVPDLGRNELCWCGSGEKYKRCHLADDDRRRSDLRAGARRPRRSY